MPEPPSIPELFIKLWSSLRSKSVQAQHERWLVWVGAPAQEEEVGKLKRELCDTRTRAVPETVWHYLETGSTDNADRRRFLVARVIDEIFERIHPRVAPRSGGAMSKIPPWLVHVRDTYRDLGSFYNAEDVYLVPASPLAPGAPKRDIEVGGSIHNCFYFLQCIAPEVSAHIELVPDPALLRSRKRARARTLDRIAVVPFATEASHLDFRLTDDPARVEAFQTSEVTAGLIATVDDDIVERLVTDKCTLP